MNELKLNEAAELIGIPPAKVLKLLRAGHLTQSYSSRDARHPRFIRSVLLSQAVNLPGACNTKLCKLAQVIDTLEAYIERM